MLTWLLLKVLNALIVIRIGTQSLISPDLHSMKQVIADNNKDNIAYWLFMVTYSLSNSTIKLYVYVSSISMNQQHQIFVFAMHIYRYVNSYVNKKRIICQKILYWILQIHISLKIINGLLNIITLYDIFQIIISLICTLLFVVKLGILFNILTSINSIKF